jgi:hypothetical protein
MPEDEYIELEDVDKHQRQEKINNIKAKISSGASSVGNFLKKGVSDLGHSIKHVATEHVAKPIKVYAEKAPERAEKAYQNKLQRMDKAKEINARRIELAKQQQELRSYQPKQTMPQMPSLGGAMFGGNISRKPQAMPSFDDVFKFDPWKTNKNLGTTKRVRKRHAKRRIKARKRSKRAYVVVNNIRYYKR